MQTQKFKKCSQKDCAHKSLGGVYKKLEKVCPKKVKTKMCSQTKVLKVVTKLWKVITKN